MISRTHARFSGVACLLTAAAMLATGCGGGGSIGSTTTSPSTQTGPSFVIGTDAPVPNVVSFTVQIESVEALDSSGNSVSLVSGTPTVDFARFNGLQTLLDMNDVPAGTYDSVTVTLGAATIGYLNQTAGSAPTVQTETANLTTSTINVTLAHPMVIANGSAPAGLRMDFDLSKSITETNGQVSQNVTPTFKVDGVTNSDPGAYIDEFVAGVVSAGTQSFVIQGPHGRQFTVNVNGQTEWDNNESISDLSTSSIVQISGTLDRADGTIDADEVAILSQDGFYAGGLITSVLPASGAASSFDLYVRGLLPTTTGLTLGQIAQVNLSGNEKYFIYWMHNPMTQFLFNQSQLLAGQHVSVGGPASGAANPQAVTCKRVVLRNWGYNGTVVANSIDATKGTFQMQVDGFAGLLIPQTITVYAPDAVGFRLGYAAISDLSGGDKVRAVGLLLNDPTAGTVLLAHYVDDLN